MRCPSADCFQELNSDTCFAHWSEEMPVMFPSFKIIPAVMGRVPLSTMLRRDGDMFNSRAKVIWFQRLDPITSFNASIGFFGGFGIGFDESGMVPQCRLRKSEYLTNLNRRNCFLSNHCEIVVLDSRWFTLVNRSHDLSRENRVKIEILCEVHSLTAVGARCSLETSGLPALLSAGFQLCFQPPP